MIRPTWLLLGSPWRLPSAMALALGSAMPLSPTKALLWSEAKEPTSTHPSMVVTAARQLVYPRAAALVLPGTVAADTVEKTWGFSPKRVIRLPHLVDENVYRDKVADARSNREAVRAAFGARPSDVVIIVPTRLSDTDKGILNFLKAIAPLRCDDVKIVITGEGPDRGLIEAWIAAHEPDRVALLGHRHQDNMVNLLAAGDALALPSLWDPNPPAIIEGLWAGLPVIVSTACGTWPETVRDGTNGWLIDPHDPASIQKAIAAMVDASPAQRETMGQASRRLAEASFCTDHEVRRFIDELLDLSA